MRDLRLVGLSAVVVATPFTSRGPLGTPIIFLRPLGLAVVLATPTDGLGAVTSRLTLIVAVLTATPAHIASRYLLRRMEALADEPPADEAAIEPLRPMMPITTA